MAYEASLHIFKTEFWETVHRERAQCIMSSKADIVKELARLLGMLARLGKEVDREVRRGLAEMLGVDENFLLQKLYELNAKQQDPEALKAEVIRALGGDPEKLADKDFAEALSRVLGVNLEAGRRVMIGFVASPFDDAGQQVLELYEKLRTRGLSENIVVEDFYTNVVTVADLINKYTPSRLVVVSVERKGRSPGIYVSRRDLRRKTEAFQALEDIRPSLDGWVSVDLLLDGITSFLTHWPREVVLVECEPGEKLCEGLEEVVLREAGVKA